MARMIGKVRTSSTGGMPQSHPAPPRSATVPEDHSDGESIHSSISATSMSVASVRSGGRAGMVRTGSVGGAGSFGSATTTHSAALGRGHNQAKLTQQNYQTFLDKTYMIPKVAAGTSAGSAQVASHLSHESTVTPTRTMTGGTTTSSVSVAASSTSATSPRSEFIYIDIEVMMHENNEIKKVAEKTLGFDQNQNIRAVMTEIAGYLEIENICPLYLSCKNPTKKLEEGTLASNEIKMDFVIEFHVSKAEHSSTDNLAKETFVSKYKSNRVYLVMLMFNTEHQLLTGPNGMLPSVEISDEVDIVEEFKCDSKEFIWMRTKSLDYAMPANEAINQGQDEDTVFSAQALQRNQYGIEGMLAQASPQKKNSATAKSLKLRSNFYRSCAVMQNELMLNRLGTMYHHPIAIEAVTGAKLIVALQFNSHPLDADKMKEHSLKWKNAAMIHPNYYNQNEDQIWALYLQYYQRQRLTLAPGVYVGLFRIKNTTDSIEVLTLKHDPDMVPLTRLRGAGNIDSGNQSTTSFASQSVSRLSTSDRSKTVTADLLNDAELLYVQHLSEKERDSNAIVPNGLSVNKELETLGTQLRSAIKVLGSQTGYSDLDLKHMSAINPVILRKDIMILMLSTSSEMQAAQKEKSGGLLSKFRGMGKVKDDSSDKNKDNANPRFFEYAPLALFEALHHSSYNSHTYANYRFAMDVFVMDQARVELANNDEKSFTTSASSEKAMRMSFSSSLHTTGSADASVPVLSPGHHHTYQQLMGAVNEKKKQWNATQSWALRIIQHNREQSIHAPNKK